MTISDAAAELYRSDPSAPAFGIELIAADLDGATVRMTIAPEMCNGFGIVHGGMVFLLADSAMAFASNSQPDPAVATTAEIDWLAPARAGQVLEARATNRWRSKKSALWDIEISDEAGHQIALFRGRTRITGSPS
jgi:acyl-CoA thioesterase